MKHRQYRIIVKCISYQLVVVETDDATDNELEKELRREGHTFDASNIDGLTLEKIEQTIHDTCYSKS